MGKKSSLDSMAGLLALKDATLPNIPKKGTDLIDQSFKLTAEAAVLRKGRDSIPQMLYTLNAVMKGSSIRGFERQLKKNNKKKDKV